MGKLLHFNTCCFIAILTQAGSVLAADKDVNQWDPVVENYLSPEKGATLEPFTNLEKSSRWYSTFRVKGGYLNDNKRDAGYLQLHGRLRGKSYFSESNALIGDFWLRGQEHYHRLKGKTIDEFNDFDDNAAWEQFIIGISNDNFGALMYGKHTATWGIFAGDLGSQGMLDSQADAGLKNAGKFLYKNHFPTNLYLAASYDRVSKIYGIDIGYQTADIYSFKPDSYAVYYSVHNGQPTISTGSSPVVGNVNIGATKRGDIKNSDSNYARADSSLYTHIISAYYQNSNNYRIVGQTAWSKRDKNESKSLIKSRGWAKGGLGHSAALGLQVFPEYGSGLNYIVYNSWDEIGGASVTPQLEYWFGSPKLRAWLSWTWEEKSDDITRIEFQWDF